MKCLIYARISSVGTSIGNRQSTESQITELKELAKNKGYDVDKIFSENISGLTKNESRTVLNECLEYATNNKIPIILCWELSRIGRNIFSIQEKIKYCIDNKINIYFKKEGISLFNDDGEVSLYTPILIDCLALVSSVEISNIKERLNRGRTDAINRGVKMGRKIGYRQSREDYMKRYPESIKLLKKGLKIPQIEVLAKSKEEKVGKSTLFTLKKMFVTS